jgi:hypothetical protein
MVLLRRMAGGALPWSVVIVAGLASGNVGAWWPNTQARPDAAMPLPRLSAAQCGPSLDEAIEQFNRKGPKWASPPGVVE